MDAISIATSSKVSQAHDAQCVKNKLTHSLGRTSMSYYSLHLYPFVSSLIRDHKKIPSIGYQLQVDDLCESEKRDFARHLIEYDKRDLYSLYENKNYDVVISKLLTLLDKYNQHNQIDFSESVCDAIVDYYKPTMQKMIDEIIGSVELEDSYEKDAEFSWEDCA